MQRKLQVAVLLINIESVCLVCEVNGNVGFTPAPLKCEYIAEYVLKYISSIT